MAQGGAIRPSGTAGRSGAAVRPGGNRDGAVGATTERAGSIVIEIAGTVIHVEPGVDTGWLRDVLRAVKAAT
jgi:hypothetical protein